MHQSTSKRKKRAHLAFIYALMITAVIAAVAILVLVIQGYRFNRYDGKVEQGGLVQFDSRPSGATVNVDGIQLANKTASKITLSAGTHLITMSRDGYTTWTKTVTVKAGSVLWLNYARLFPTKPVTTTLASYAAYGSSLVSPDRKQLAFVAEPNLATLYIAPLNDDKPSIRKVTINADKLTAASDPASVSYSLVAWDRDNRFTILKRAYDDKSEYLSIDTQNGGTKNITTLLGISVSHIEYSIGDSNDVYILNADHQVRRGDLSAATLSGPLLSGVSDFTQADRSTLTYETTLSDSGARSVGYLTNGASTPRTVRTVTDDGSPTFKFRMGAYYGERYFVIAYGDATTIYQADVPSSDSTSSLSMTRVANLTTTGGVKYLDFSPATNRFVYAQQGATVETYDLEVGTSSRVTLQGELTRELDWIDASHIGSTAGDAAYYYDFDGSNGQMVAPKVKDAPITISENGKYLYYLAPSDDKTVLKRIQLTN